MVYREPGGSAYVAGTKQMRIASVRSLARKLIADCGEGLAKDYLTPEDFRLSLDSSERDVEEHIRRLQGRRMIDLANIYISDGEFSDVTKRTAVLLALKELIPQGEMEAEGRYRKRLSGFNRSEETKRRAGEAASKRWEALSEKERLAERERLARVSGIVVWSQEELGFLNESLLDPEYQYKTGPHKGDPDYRKIEGAVNSRFSNNRSQGAIKTAAYKIRKDKNKVEEPVEAL